MNDYGQEDLGDMDQGNPEMFGNGGQDPDDDGGQEEYFDDAGDIGYLPADHVSFKFQIYRFIFYLNLI